MVNMLNEKADKCQVELAVSFVAQYLSAVVLSSYYWGHMFFKLMLNLIGKFWVKLEYAYNKNPAYTHKQHYFYLIDGLIGFLDFNNIYNFFL